MGKIMRVGNIIPVKQRYNMALTTVVAAISTIQRWVREVRMRIRAKNALKRLNHLVLKYNFESAKQKFDTDFVRLDEKGEEKVQEKFEREERLRKLKPMKSRVLMFKNRTFRIDT